MKTVVKKLREMKPHRAAISSILLSELSSRTFASLEIDPAFFSIRDTMGDLQKHPRAGAILEQMMAKMRAARGEVAQSAANNDNLRRMMAGMKLESLLKQAGNVPEEVVKTLNAALQKIKK